MLKNKLSTEEKKEIAGYVVDEFWDRLSTEVGLSILKKVMWGLVLLGMSIVYMGWPGGK